MRRRPWSLVVLAVLHFVAPIGNIFLNAVVADRNILSYFVQALSPEYLARNWVIIVAPVVAGFAIYACKKWSFYVYILSITVLFWFSYTGYLSKASHISLWPIMLVYLVNIFVVSYILIPAVRNIYFDRRMRWWEIQARYKCGFDCSWLTSGKDVQHDGNISNISLNGLFLVSPDKPKDKEIITIRFSFSGQDNCEFVGEAIHHNRLGIEGFGVKFIHTKESKKLSKKLVGDLESKGMKISNGESRPEDSFIHWVKTLVTTGKGIVPSKEK